MVRFNITSQQQPSRIDESAHVGARDGRKKENGVRHAVRTSTPTTPTTPHHAARYEETKKANRSVVEHVEHLSYMNIIS